MKEAITSIAKQLNRIHTIMFGATIVALLAVMFILFYFGDPNNVVAENYENITAEQIIMLLTLIAIPVSLKMHSNQMKKLKANKNATPVEKVKEYTKAFVKRISILEVVALTNIIFYAIKHVDNFMWLAVISLIAFVFCRASEKELHAILTEEKEEESTDEK